MVGSGTIVHEPKRPTYLKVNISNKFIKIVSQEFDLYLNLQKTINAVNISEQKNAGTA